MSAISLKNKRILYVSISMFFAFFLFTGKARALVCECAGQLESTLCDTEITRTLNMDGITNVQLFDLIAEALDEGSTGCAVISAGLSAFKDDILAEIGPTIPAPTNCTDIFYDGEYTAAFSAKYRIGCFDTSGGGTTIPPSSAGTGSNVQPVLTKEAAEAAQAVNDLKSKVNELNVLGAGVDAATLIGRVISTVMGVVGSIALMMFVAGGLMWMTARGNSERIGLALRTITWSALGIIVILSSYVIVSFIFGVF